MIRSQLSHLQTSPRTSSRYLSQTRAYRPMTTPVRSVPSTRRSPSPSRSPGPQPSTLLLPPIHRREAASHHHQGARRTPARIRGMIAHRAGECARGLGGGAQLNTGEGGGAVLRTLSAREPPRGFGGGTNTRFLVASLPPSPSLPFSWFRSAGGVGVADDDEGVGGAWAAARAAHHHRHHRRRHSCCCCLFVGRLVR
jgi:hypothetical protein